MTLTAEDIKKYVEYQEAMGPVTGGDKLKFVREEDLTEDSDIHDRWLVKLTEKYDSSVKDMDLAARLIKKIEYLEPMTVADFEELKRLIA